MKELQDALKKVTEELKSDMDYRRSWHSNISMAFQDHANDAGLIVDTMEIKRIADRAADHFINQLCDCHWSVTTEY